MSELMVYDPAMCCSSGVCGPQVDPALVRFAADVESLGASGVSVRRFNLGLDAQEFMRNPAVRRALQAQGTACLPLVVAHGEIVSRGRYPSRDELAFWSARAEAPVREAGTGAGCAPGSGCCGG